MNSWRRWPRSFARARAVGARLRPGRDAVEPAGLRAAHRQVRSRCRGSCGSPRRGPSARRGVGGTGSPGCRQATRRFQSLRRLAVHAAELGDSRRGAARRGGARSFGGDDRTELGRRTRRALLRHSTYGRTLQRRPSCRWSPPTPRLHRPCPRPRSHHPSCPATHCRRTPAPSAAEARSLGHSLPPASRAPSTRFRCARRTLIRCHPSPRGRSAAR